MALGEAPYVVLMSSELIRTSFLNHLTEVISCVWLSKFTVRVTGSFVKICPLNEGKERIMGGTVGEGERQRERERERERQGERVCVQK